MDNICKFTDRSTIEQEAAQWLIRLDGDEPLSKRELAALREWLARSPRHRKELNNLNSFWANNILTELVVPLGRHETRRGWRALLTQVLRSVPSLAATVAALMVLAGIGLWFFSNPLIESNGLYLTAVGQQKSLTMADGTVVQLNTNSQIQVEYNEQYRNIRLLQGEAHFEVAKDAQHPFRVYAGAGRAQAVGTAFTVYLKDDGVNVLVTEGRVALASLGRSTPMSTTPSPPEVDKPAAVDPYVNTASNNLGILKAGEAVTLDTTDAGNDGHTQLMDVVQVIDEDELTRRQSWRQGLLVFSGEPLEQVVLEISRYTTVSIEIPDPDLRQIQIGGRFKVGDIDNMFDALETNFGVKVNRLNYNRVQLKAAE